MSSSFKSFICWLVPSLLACAIAIQWTAGSYIDGSYVPMGGDSFYHARRILDAVSDLSSFYQFDPRIHAPEGSWITWPWLYDWLIASVITVIQTVTGTQQSMMILVLIPVYWVFVNSALLFRIGSALDLSIYSKFLFLLTFALSPTTQVLHGLGRIDHHYMEMTAVFGVLLGGLLWLKTQSRRHALILGVALGLVNGIHNGLFILIVPLALALALRWWQGVSINLRSTGVFIGSYLTTLVLVLLPSEPFQQGLFEFYTLSWFHLYVGLAFSAYVFFLQRLPRTTKNLIGLTLLLVILGAPLGTEILGGLIFISGNLFLHDQIGESFSILRMMNHEAFGVSHVSKYYSLLVWLVPLTVFLIGRELWLSRRIDTERNYLWIFSVFGLVLLLQQFRFHFFGSFALVLPYLILIESKWLPTWKTKVKQVCAGALVLGSMMPGMSRLTETVTLAPQYNLYRPMYLALAEVCEAAPGVVLADPADGHFIRYHTECSVISNFFLQSKQHIEKFKLTSELMHTPVKELVEENPWIDYLLLHPIVEDSQVVEFAASDIRRELLDINSETPAQLRLVLDSKNEVRLGNSTYRVARLFAVR